MNFIGLVMNDYDYCYELARLQTINQSLQSINCREIHKLRFIFMNFINLIMNYFSLLMNDYNYCYELVCIQTMN